MSSDNSHTVALGTRTNIFDSEAGEWDLNRNPGDPTIHEHSTDTDDTATSSIAEMLDRDRGAHEYVAGVSRDQYIAGSLLRSLGNPTLYCPVCWDELETRGELTEPLHHQPLVEERYEWDAETATLEHMITKNDHRRHRHCTNCGAISFGGRLADRDVESFLQIVDTVLDALDHVPELQQTKLRDAAEERKRDDWSDETNLECLLNDLRYSAEN